MTRKRLNFYGVLGITLFQIGCGASQEIRTANLTAFQQQLILDTAQAAIGSNPATPDPIQGPIGSMPYDPRNPFLTLADGTEAITETIECDSGTVVGDLGNSSGTITASDCVTFEGVSSDEQTNLHVNGSILYTATSTSSSTARVSFSYDDITVRRGARSCDLAGAVTANISSSTTTSNIPLSLSLTTTCGAYSVRATGNVTLSEESIYVYANGVMTFAVGSSAPHDCVLSHFNVKNATCATLAQACRFPASVCTRAPLTSEIAAP